MQEEVKRENQQVNPQQDERGLMRRDTFEGGELLQQAETSSTAAAETAKALVQARYIMALKRPRNQDVSAQRIKQACQRPRFAQEVEYAKPIGNGTIQGPSIRFADEAIKLWGNVDIRTMTTYEDDMVRKVQIEVTDLETNVSKSQEVMVNKTIERRNPTAGREVVGKRKNKQGAWVYQIKATDDEILIKENATIAKARRNLELQLIPQDIIDEAVEIARGIRGKRDAEDPKAAKKKLLDAFGSVGVMPDELEAFLGHSLEQISNQELDSLRAVYTSIQQGESSWKDFLLDALENAKTRGQPSEATQAVHDRIKSRGKPPAQEPSSQPEAAQDENKGPQAISTPDNAPEPRTDDPPAPETLPKIDASPPPTTVIRPAETPQEAPEPEKGVNPQAEPESQPLPASPPEAGPQAASGTPGSGASSDFLGFDSQFLANPEAYTGSYRVEIGGQSGAFREMLTGAGWDYGVKHGFGRKYFKAGLSSIEARNWVEWSLTISNPENEEGDGAVDANILNVEIVSEENSKVVFSTKS